MVNTLFAAFGALGVVGIAGLFVATMLGFETPNATLLFVSAVFVFLAPIAVFSHLTFTAQLTREEKLLCFRELTSWRAGAAFGAYVTSDDRRATARILAESVNPPNS
jgi:hypothetical protein